MFRHTSRISESDTMELSLGTTKLGVCALVLAALLVIDANQVSAVERNRCALRVVDKANQKAVCVCNATYCDNLVFKWPQTPGEAYLIESSRSGSRLDASKLVTADWDWCGKVDDKLVVELGREHQSILGFGGAFTDAGGINVMGLSEVLRNKLVETYYGEHGSQYNFGRVTISGIDCSTHPYSYDDMPKGEKDYNLTKWSLAPEDMKYKIPLIKQALEMVKTYNSSLKLFGSSWSPPAWMKDNESLVRGHLIDSDQIYESYAQYLVKFYNAYKSHGIEFWGGTLQNEPIAALSPSYNFNSLELRDADAVRLIVKHLGPALAANGYTKDKFKLMVGDDNLGSINDQVRYIMSHKEVYPYVAGLAFHWYRNLEPNIYPKLTEIYDQIKDHIEFALMTEACIEPGREVPVDLGSWPRGERYANDIIEDLLRQSGGWIEWNMALDEQGGPNWVRNFLDAAIVVSNNKTEFYKQPMYYALAHFSRFFRPGSVRVDVTTNVISPSDNKAVADKQVSAVAVHKKDTGHVVVNILNKSEEPKMLIVKALDVGKAVRIQGKSINTVVIKL